jgi:hypothetical protein
MDWNGATLDQRLQHLQYTAVAYFHDETNLLNGLILDTTAPDRPASIAAPGIAPASNPVAIERGLTAQSAAIARALIAIRLLWSSPEGPEPDRRLPRLGYE